MYGKITIEQAQQLARDDKEGATELLAIGDRVRTSHGYEGVISDISVYGQDSHLWWNWSTYYVKLDAGGTLGVDFVDAHFTCGGTLKKLAA